MKKLLTISFIAGYFAVVHIACNNNNEEAPVNNCQSVIDSLQQTNCPGTFYIEVKKQTGLGPVTIYRDTTVCE